MLYMFSPVFALLKWKSGRCVRLPSKKHRDHGNPGEIMNLRSLCIGTRLAIGFGIILSLLIAALVTDNLISTRNRSSTIEGLELNNQKSMLVTVIKSSLLESGIAMRNIGLQSDLAAMKKEEDKVKALRKQYTRASEKLVAMSIIIGALALSVGGALAWMLTRSITQPLQEAVGVARRVAAGELTSHVSVAGKDEVSELLAALRDMNDSLQKIVGEVRMGTDSITVASREIASGNADLSARTELQAEALQKTAGSMDQLTKAVRQNAEHTGEANRLVISASDSTTR
jgi:methyl-accepting chemotaxis protein